MYIYTGSVREREKERKTEKKREWYINICINECTYEKFNCIYKYRKARYIEIQTNIYRDLYIYIYIHIHIYIYTYI